jgi:hypothetical protein
VSLLLLHLLLTAGALGVLHLVMGRKGPVPWVPFVAAGAVAHVVVGLAVMGRALLAQAARSAPSALWIPAMALGLFVTGAVLAAGWLAAVLALERALGRRAG